MTPEQPTAPEAQENTTPNPSPEEFVIPENVPHSGEGVIDEFDNTALETVATDLEAAGVPEHPGAIDTDTLAFPYTPLEKPITPSTTEAEPKKGRRGLIAGIAGTATALALTAGAMIMRSGDDVSATPESKPSSSASPNPGETSAPNESEAPQTNTPESIIGVAGTTLETINTPPSEALLKEALRPVVAETPKEAIKTFEALLNIRDLSGSVNEEGAIAESDASMELRTQIDSFIFENGTPNIHDFDGSDFSTGLNVMREVIAASYWYHDIAGDGPKDQEPTFRKSWEIVSIDQTGPTQHTAELLITRESNLDQYSPQLTDNISDWEFKDLKGQVTIREQDGKWVISSLVVNGL